MEAPHLLNRLHAIGHMDRRIEIYAVTETRTATGAVTMGETKIADAWAKLEYVTGSQGGGKESEAGGKLTDFTTATFTIRHDERITPKHYIRYNSQDYDIKAITEEGRDRFIKLITQLRK